MAILGVSHFVAASEEAGSVAEEVCATGVWSPGMTALGLPIDPGKAGYLTFDQSEHDLRLLRHTSASPGIEFVRYPHVPQQVGHYRVLFGEDDPTSLLAALMLKEPQTGACISWAGVADAPPRAFGLRIAEMERSGRFWGDGIGFETAKHLDDGSRFHRFPTFMRGWQSGLLLVPAAGKQQRAGMLDDQGWNCVSLLVDEPVIVGRRLLEFGGTDLTSEIRVSVPGKNGKGRRDLRLTFLRGPDGEIVELLAAASLLDMA